MQTDRQDKCALGWDHQEKLQLHDSQKGTSVFTLVLGALSEVGWLSVTGPVDMLCSRCISVHCCFVLTVWGCPGPPTFLRKPFSQCRIHRPLPSGRAAGGKAGWSPP